MSDGFAEEMNQMHTEFTNQQQINSSLHNKVKDLEKKLLDEK